MRHSTGDRKLDSKKERELARVQKSKSFFVKVSTSTSAYQCLLDKGGDVRHIAHTGLENLIPWPCMRDIESTKSCQICVFMTVSLMDQEARVIITDKQLVSPSLTSSPSLFRFYPHAECCPSYFHAFLPSASTLP